MPVGEDWSHKEVDAAVAAYLSMLLHDLEDRPYTKVSFNRLVRATAASRSKGSVEFKFANVSAAMIEMGYGYVDGYKPRGNFQHLLLESTARHLDAMPELREAMKRAVERPDVPIGRPALKLVELGVAETAQRRGAVLERPASLARVVDWLAIEASNAARGRDGEELVLRWEHQRLWNAGARSLADRVEHVASTRGDGLGYDIHSYEADGQDRLIEVKTTRFGKQSPFFASRNEVKVSAVLADEWHLYRVFDVRRKPQFYIEKGSLQERFALDPVVFEVRVA